MLGRISVYGVQEQRGYLNKRLMSMGYTFAFFVVLLLTLLLTVFGGSILQALPLDSRLFRFLDDLIGLRFLLLFLLQTGLFTAMFMALPNTESTFRQALPGAVLSSFGWLTFSKIYSVYVAYSSEEATLFGPVYTLAVGMLWIYFCISIVLYGGALNRACKAYGKLKGVVFLFGFVVADLKELSKEEQKRYSSVYCGICRRIRKQFSSQSRMGLSYDMAFLALLLMSLYEPEEEQGKRACGIHPLRARPWVDNPYIRYSADMNVALAYYKALDDYNAEHKPTAKWSKGVFGKSIARIEQQYPRQCAAMADCITQLSALEKDGCSNPDLPAGVFGALMAELFVYEEDLWSENLRKTGDALGRFIYLADAAIDYRKDCKK